MPRIRSRVLSKHTGVQYTMNSSGVPSVITNKTVNMMDQSTKDDVLPGDGHFFDSTTRSFSTTGGLSLPYVNGKANVTSGSYTQYKDYIGKGIDEILRTGHMATGSPSDAYFGAQVLAKTNPSRPEVDLPIFFVELKDIPQMIKLAGKSIPEKGASANLSWQFGWKPLINDLKSILTFQDAVEKRFKELKAMVSKGSLTRTADLGDYSGTGSSTSTSRVTLATSAIVNQVLDWDAFTHEVVWGSVRWKPDLANYPYTDAELHSLAKKAVLGLTIDPSTVWELLPWSWLTDWFSNVGAYLSANRNIIPASPSNLCIMREFQTVYTSKKAPTASHVAGLSVNYDCNWKIHSKTRKPASSQLAARLNWLSPTQWGILASLAILRGKVKFH